MAIFFTSDTHFGHAGALALYRRPFASVAAMDEGLVERWNEAVAPADEVWHLGDFAIRQSAERAADLLARLNGRKHLVAGNNDPPATQGLAGWSSVQPYAELMIDERRLVLCHYAFRTWRDMSRGAVKSPWPQSWPDEAAAAADRCRRRRLGFPAAELARAAGAPRAGAGRHDRACRAMTTAGLVPAIHVLFCAARALAVASFDRLRSNRCRPPELAEGRDRREAATRPIPRSAARRTAPSSCR
jgi:hypothetical protein